MSIKERLDSQIRTHQALAKIDAALAKDAAKKARLAWLAGLIRDGHPLPDTPEGLAETQRIYEAMDRIGFAAACRSEGYDDADIGIRYRVREPGFFSAHHAQDPGVFSRAAQKENGSGRNTTNG